MANNYFVGVDLGQCRDYTAIAAVERVELLGEWSAATFSHTTMVVPAAALSGAGGVRCTPYPGGGGAGGASDAVARGLAGRCRVIVDGTGVGRPVVVDLLRGEPGRDAA